MLTEVTSEICLFGIRRPFAVYDVLLVIDVESKLVESLRISSQLSRDERGEGFTLEKLSILPSVSLMVLIHS